MSITKKDLYSSLPLLASSYYVSKQTGTGLDLTNVGLSMGLQVGSRVIEKKTLNQSGLKKHIGVGVINTALGIVRFNIMKDQFDLDDLKIYNTDFKNPGMQLVLGLNLVSSMAGSYFGDYFG